MCGSGSQSEHTVIRASLTSTPRSYRKERVETPSRVRAAMGAQRERPQNKTKQLGEKDCLQVNTFLHVWVSTNSQDISLTSKLRGIFTCLVPPEQQEIKKHSSAPQSSRYTSLIGRISEIQTLTRRTQMFLRLWLEYNENEYIERQQ